MKTNLQVVLLSNIIILLLAACAAPPTPDDRAAIETLMAQISPPPGTGRIEGSLFQSPNSRIPVSDAAITLFALQFDFPPGETRTDPQGRYSFSKLPPGMYSLTVSGFSISAEEFCMTGSTVILEDGEVLEQDLVCGQQDPPPAVLEPGGLGPVFPTPSEPQFGDIRFATDSDPYAYQGLNPRTIFPVGIDQVMGLFDCFLPTEEELHTVWYKDMDSILEEKIVLGPGNNHCQRTLSDPDGLSEGAYDLKVYLGEQLVKEGHFEVRWWPTVWPVTFAQGLDANDRPIIATNLFPIGTTLVYAVFTVENFTKGQPMFYELYYNDQSFLSDSEAWAQSNSAGNWYITLKHEKGFPPGRYVLRLYVDNQTQIASFAVE